MKPAPSKKFAARLGLAALLAGLVMITAGSGRSYGHAYARLLSATGRSRGYRLTDGLQSEGGDADDGPRRYSLYGGGERLSGGGSAFLHSGGRSALRAAPRVSSLQSMQDRLEEKEYQLWEKEGLLESQEERLAQRREQYGAPDGRRSVQAKLSLGEEILEAASSQFDPSAVKKMVVRKGWARVRTAADVFKVADAAIKLVEDAGGYVEKRSDENDYNPKSELTLRVPVDRYADVLDTVRTSIGGLTTAEEVYESTDEVRDVTGEYVGAAARAASLEATRKQLEALMVRADDVKDVLEVQREFAQVTAQVEAEKAVVARLGKQASFSTLSLVIRHKREHAPVIPRGSRWSVAGQVDRSCKRVRRLTQRAMSQVIFLAVASVPLVLLALLASCLLRCVPRAVKARLSRACGDAYELVGPKAVDP